MIFQEHNIILFQGDSITDCERGRNGAEDLGAGYAMMAAGWIQAMHPEKHLRILNRGVGGNRVVDLKARWKQDCLELKPDWISIMIGINDCWRRYDSGELTTVEDYERDYHDILQQSRQDNPDVRFILIDPYVLPTPPDRVAWREDLDPKIEVVRRLVKEFNAIHIPMDDIFKEAASRREPAFWAEDGVHPSHAGHALIAQSWLRAVET